MKITKSFLYLILFSLGMILSSCSDDDDDENAKTGVHKIEIEISGNNDLEYSAVFAGTSENGISKLYDKEGKFLGNQKIYSLTVENCKNLICYTDDQATYLSLVFTINGGFDDQQYSYSIKSYINNKLVDTIEDKGTVGFGKPVMLSVITSE